MSKSLKPRRPNDLKNQSMPFRMEWATNHNGVWLDMWGNSYSHMSLWQMKRLHRWLERAIAHIEGDTNE